MAQASRGSGTTTETVQLQDSRTPEQPQVQTVILRLAPRKKKKVSWRSDTVDNEHMQKKKSKICCIFHKDDDDDDSGDDGDEGSGKGKGKEHDHHHDCNHGTDDANGSVEPSDHGATSSS